MGRVALHNIHEGIAYDGEYYHGNLLLQVEPNPEGGTIQIMDFSQYESHQLIGCTIRTNAYDKEWYNIYPIPNVVVFQPMEGVWTWKFGSQ